MYLLCLSVSRIGSAAQTKGMKQVAGTIKLELAQYREIESFASFASELDSATKKVLNRGVRLMEVIKQKNKNILSYDKQVLLLFAAVNGYLDGIETKRLEAFKIYLLNFFRESNLLDNFSALEPIEVEFLNKVFNQIINA